MPNFLDLPFDCLTEIFDYYDDTLETIQLLRKLNKNIYHLYIEYLFENSSVCKKYDKFKYDVENSDWDDYEYMYDFVFASNVAFDSSMTVGRKQKLISFVNDIYLESNESIKQEKVQYTKLNRYDKTPKFYHGFFNVKPMVIKVLNKYKDYLYNNMSSIIRDEISNRMKKDYDMAWIVITNWPEECYNLDDVIFGNEEIVLFVLGKLYNWDSQIYIDEDKIVAKISGRLLEKNEILDMTIKINPYIVFSGRLKNKIKYNEEFIKNCVEQLTKIKYWWISDISSMIESTETEYVREDLDIEYSKYLVDYAKNDYDSAMMMVKYNVSYDVFFERIQNNKNVMVESFGSFTNYWKKYLVEMGNDDADNNTHYSIFYYENRKEFDEDRILYFDGMCDKIEKNKWDDFENFEENKNIVKELFNKEILYYNNKIEELEEEPDNNN